MAAGNYESPPAIGYLGKPFKTVPFGTLQRDCNFLASGNCLTFDCPEWDGFLHSPVPLWVACGEGNRKSCLIRTCCPRSRRLWGNRASRNLLATVIRAKSSILVEIFPRPSRQSKPQSKIVRRPTSYVSRTFKRFPKIDESFPATCRSSLWKIDDDGQPVSQNARWHLARTIVLGCCRALRRCWNPRLHSRD